MSRGPRGFFGELYLRSTRPFLRDHVTDAEGAYLSERLREAGVAGPVLDLGCGHGRHLARVRAQGWNAVGLDSDARSLAEARQHGPVVQGDFFCPPFLPATLGAAYCWYNTLFTFEDDEQREALAAVARCVAPGGLVVLQGSAKALAAQNPVARYDGLLPDGCRLEERCDYDSARSRDVISRRLTLPDGRVMAADFFIRYYDPDEVRALVEAAGLTLKWVHGGVDGSAPTPLSSELIVGAQRRG